MCGALKLLKRSARFCGCWVAQQVQVPDMANAITLTQFYLSEASRLASAATVSAEIDKAETLRKWLLESWPHSEIMVREVGRVILPKTKGMRK